MYSQSTRLSIRGKNELANNLFKLCDPQFSKKENYQNMELFLRTASLYKCFISMREIKDCLSVLLSNSSVSVLLRDRAMEELEHHQPPSLEDFIASDMLKEGDGFYKEAVKFLQEYLHKRQEKIGDIKKEYFRLASIAYSKENRKFCKVFFPGQFFSQEQQSLLNKIVMNLVKTRSINMCVATEDKSSSLRIIGRYCWKGDEFYAAAYTTTLPPLQIRVSPFNESGL